VREWVPVSTSPKGRLALAAVKAFGARSFEEVTVAELATAAKVTTGALYHHFGSKLGLYAFVREDVERRLLDRMEGAIAASASASDRSPAVMAALLVGFDFAVREGFLHILGEPPAGTDVDRLAQLLDTLAASPVLSRVLAAAWRAALGAVAEGSDPEQARAALLAFELRVPSER
jgi:AcrR family transcriptional regulator